MLLLIAQDSGVNRRSVYIARNAVGLSHCTYVPNAITNLFLTLQCKGKEKRNVATFTVASIPTPFPRFAFVLIRPVSKTSFARSKAYDRCIYLDEAP